MNWYKRQLKIAYSANRGWTEEELNSIKNLYENGYTSIQIAPLFGVNPATINKMNNKYKWRDFKAEKAERDKLILDAYLLPPDGKGMTTDQIKNQYGAGEPAIKGALKRSNLLHLYRGKSDAQKIRYTDPEKRKQMSDIHKKRYVDNPELASNFGEESRRRWQDPEFRNKMEEIAKSDKNRQQQSDYMKLRWEEYKKTHPGGWEEWVSQFPPETQSAMRAAMWAGKSNRVPM